MTKLKPIHIRPNGSFNVQRHGMRKSFGRDLYHFFISCRWWLFLVLLIGLYMLLNLCFAGLYALDPVGISQAQPGSLKDAFFFSVQTMSTVGYGSMSPVTTYAHTLMVVQSVVSYLFTALSTGLVFAKFAKVRAQVLFSQKALIQPYNGKPALTFRAANERSSQIVEATVKVFFSRNEFSQEGVRERRIYDLSLLRDSTPLFSLVWNVYHPIEPGTPLYGETEASLIAGQCTLMITFTGIDDVLGQTVHSRYAYNAHEILFNHRFVDIIDIDDEGVRSVNYLHFHQQTALPIAEHIRWETQLKY